MTVKREEEEENISPNNNAIESSRFPLVAADMHACEISLPVPAKLPRLIVVVFFLSLSPLLAWSFLLSIAFS